MGHPLATSARSRGYHGVSMLDPLGSATRAFVQRKGYIVRDIDFDFSRDRVWGSDLTAFASHLTENNSIILVGLPAAPFSVVWMVLKWDDGGLTYNKGAAGGLAPPRPEDGLVKSVLRERGQRGCCLLHRPQRTYHYRAHGEPAALRGGGRLLASTAVCRSMVARKRPSPPTASTTPTRP